MPVEDSSGVYSHPLRALFVSAGDAGDPDYWSGIPFRMHYELIQGGWDIHTASPLNDWAKYLYLQSKLIARRNGQEVLWDRAPALLHSYAWQIKTRLRAHNYDLVLSPSSIPVAKLNTEVPIVIWTDATVQNLLYYYPSRHLSAQTSSSVRMAQAQESAALRRAALCIYTSTWAAECAKNFYGVEDRRILVLPFGSNLSHKPDAHEIINIVDKRPFNECRLLFIGIEWTRKGGPCALAVARQLNHSGLPTRLTIIGAPELCRVSLPPQVRYLGPIRKSTLEGGKRIEDELSRAHFLILPTLADATPVVVSEAGSFGVPVLTVNTGGIADTVEHGVNGWLMPAGAEPNSYVKIIRDCFANHGEYRRRAIASYEFFNTRLDWARSIGKLTSVVSAMVHKTRAKCAGAI